MVTFTLCTKENLIVVFVTTLGNIARIVRQSFIFGPLAVRKRFSVLRLLMVPPIVPPDLGVEERERIGRVRKLEITNCFTFR